MVVSVKKTLLTPNQVVATNLEAARKRKGWSQLWACNQLSRLGLHWTRSNWAVAISTTAKGTRIRQFSADEITAFALLFDCPISNLFIPPPGSTVMLVGGPSLSAHAMRSVSSGKK